MSWKSAPGNLLLLVWDSLGVVYGENYMNLPKRQPCKDGGIGLNYLEDSNVNHV